MVDPLDILNCFYPEDTPLRRLLLKHSSQVRDKAAALLAAAPEPVRRRTDGEAAAVGAMLHDVGIVRCFAPGILCNGDAPYIAHGVIGAAMLREYGAERGVDLEPFARICERHTGSGLAAGEVREHALPLPVRDYLPETNEEKLICLADKFYSKSGDMLEKPLPAIRRSMLKFGDGPAARFDGLCRTFGI
ncbi:MAG: HD domain-containing protein [Victivallaceae bacterium]|nr:HD domain-containing protein [Victivallaceae bacterium]